MSEELAARSAAEHEQVERDGARALLEVAQNLGWNEKQFARFLSVHDTFSKIERYEPTVEEWFTCDGLLEWAQFELSTLNESRFEPLAISWCERIRPLLAESNETPSILARFDAYLKWKSGTGPHPDDIFSSFVWRCAEHNSRGHGNGEAAVHHLIRGDFFEAALDAGIAAGSFEQKDRGGDANPDEFLVHYRDVVGNLFRPISFDPAWLTETVVALARSIYEANAFDRMPILADALEEAGCDAVEVLIHCRNPNQTHVRGCWVVDSVLGRKGGGCRPHVS
jgi:hypothetical protein